MGARALTRTGRRRFVLSRESLRDYGVLATLIMMFIGLSLWSDAFLTQVNITNVLSQVAPIGILACGATIVIISGGFDLSAGAVYALAGVIAAETANASTPWIGLAMGVVAGLLLGVVNGLIVTMLKVNAFIATLAAGLIFRGVATVITDGFLVRVDKSGFDVLGRGEFLGLKISVYIFAGVGLVCGFLLTRTQLGRYIHAIGGNSVAASLSGIRVDLIRIIAFSLSGMLAGLAGVVTSSRISTGQADLAVGIELVAIAAVIVGGTSPTGGQGAIWRSAVGVLLLALISNGFNLLGINSFYLPIVQGGIIIFAVGADSWARGRLHWRRRG